MGKGGPPSVSLPAGNRRRPAAFLLPERRWRGPRCTAAHWASERPGLVSTAVEQSRLLLARRLEVRSCPEFCLTHPDFRNLRLVWVLLVLLVWFWVAVFLAGCPRPHGEGVGDVGPVQKPPQGKAPFCLWPLGTSLHIAPLRMEASFIYTVKGANILSLNALYVCPPSLHPHQQVAPFLAPRSSPGQSLL